MDKLIKVRATKLGFHGRLWTPGETFEVGSAAFSPKWMEKVEAQQKAKTAKRAAEDSEAETK